MLCIGTKYELIAKLVFVLAITNNIYCNFLIVIDFSEQLNK